jgi:4,5-DOPA dioxygenase extradiol
MPLLFVGHGNPMNAIEATPYAAAWEAMGKTLPKPRAILCISAHWETMGTMVTAMPQPPTIHDFFGFPDNLYQITYGAPGSPELAAEVQQLISATSVAADLRWGLDHGAWSVLRRLFPAADIPIVQLSLDRRATPQQHIDIAGQLLPLRQRGVLIVGSGNLVHNLQLIRWQEPTPYPWAEEFDQLVRQLILAGDLARLANYRELGDAARRSIPTNEHYLPALYPLALRQPEEEVTFFAEGIDLGSISMRSFRIG